MLLNIRGSGTHRGRVPSHGLRLLDLDCRPVLDMFPVSLEFLVMRRIKRSVLKLLFRTAYVSMRII